MHVSIPLNGQTYAVRRILCEKILDFMDKILYDSNHE